MPKLIKDNAIIDDSWTLLEEDLTLDGLSNGNIIVPIAFWLQNKAALIERVGETGVWLNGDEDPAQLADDTATLPLIAINFPVFTDGRGFSTGRLLRERYGFKGELRATGYFLRDQMCYLGRCGFSAFTPPAEANVEGFLKSLHDFTEFHQSAVDQPIPLFRRRA